MLSCPDAIQGLCSYGHQLSIHGAPWRSMYRDIPTRSRMSFQDISSYALMGMISYYIIVMRPYCLIGMTSYALMSIKTHALKDITIDGLMSGPTPFAAGRPTPGDGAAARPFRIAAFPQGSGWGRLPLRGTGLYRGPNIVGQGRGRAGTALARVSADFGDDPCREIENARILPHRRMAAC